jgi:hypothetical protein
MKQITLDFDTYQNELSHAKTLGNTEAIRQFKNTLIKNIEIKNIPVEDSFKLGVPPHYLQSAKKPAYDWFQNNFTDEELKILFTN